MTRQRKFVVMFLAAALVGGSTTVATASASASEAVVTTTDGTVRGSVSAEQRTFLGIPYAAPPVGDLRWRAPEPVTPWSGVRDATHTGSPCPQLADTQIVGAEDCLYLNVHTPRDSTEPRPVMVFLHGGGVTSGHGAQYDPSRVVKQGDVIVVTINYRLGALGFLDHPGNSDPYTGNFGIADQQAALRWVQHNITAFGGDPSNVTLWGQSGGGFSVCAQLASPTARGLFAKAIVQSAPCGNALRTRPAALTHGLEFASKVGCSTLVGVLDCLRTKPFRDFTSLYMDQQDQLVRGVGDRPWWPVAGTPAIPLQPLTAMQLGLAANVPMIHGGTRDEMRGPLVGAGMHDITTTEYAKVVRDIFGARAAHAILARYPAAAYSSPGIALATLLTDDGGMVGACSQLPANDAASRWSPVYAYEFAEPATESIPGFPLGAHHSVDLPYFFNVEWATSNQDELATKLIDYWTTFARTGAPGPDWPAYRHNKALSISNDRIGPVNVAREHNCGFWKA